MRCVNDTWAQKHSVSEMFHTVIASASGTNQFHLSLSVVEF
jgi:hypothetical protein